MQGKGYSMKKVTAIIDSAKKGIKAANKGLNSVSKKLDTVAVAAGVVEEEIPGVIAKVKEAVSKASATGRTSSTAKNAANGPKTARKAGKKA